MKTQEYANSMKYKGEVCGRRSYRWWSNLDAATRDHLITKHILLGRCGGFYKPHHHSDGWVIGICWQMEGKP